MEPTLDPTIFQIWASSIKYLKCNRCGKNVSTGFIPVPNEMGNDLVVRAWIECPECIERKGTGG